MIPIPPDRAPPAERPVHGPRHANCQAPEAAAERPRIIGLDDEVNVVVLDAEMKNSEPAVRGSSERAADGREHLARPQAADGRPCAQRHVHRLRGDVRRPRNMRHARAPAGDGLSPGADATPTPSTPRGKG